ncbi:MAG: aminotransferase class V-fold PLP-dependent enzyme [Halobaculum sp.]
MTEFENRPPFGASDTDLPSDFAELRESIPACEDVSYFNTGATGPSPAFLLDAVDDWNRFHKTDVLVSGDAYEVGFDAYDSCRERIAPFLGANPEEIALTESTADGLSAVLAAIDWNADDVIVTTDLEHPAADVPLARLRRHHDVTVRRVETDAGRIDTEAFAEAVADARVAVLSSLAWNYGTRLPTAELVEIADDAGAFTLVDAVQEPGQCPVDLSKWGADAVVGSGHKWLLGVWGSGFLYVADDASEELRPAQVSYRSVEDPETSGRGSGYELKSGAARFERGTAAIGPHVGFTESVRLFESLGVESIRAEILRLTERLTEQIPTERLLSPSEPETGLVTVNVAEPEATVERLADAGFAVRSLPDPDSVRVSVHCFNSEGEVDGLAEELTDEF